MKRTRYDLGLMFVLILVGCTPQRKRSSKIIKEELVQISMSSNGRAQDTTGGFAIELNKNLSVQYFGGSQSELAGAYRGEVSKEDWVRITQLVETQKISDATFHNHSFEDNYFDLSIKLRHKAVYISGYYSSAPQHIKEICKEILSIKSKIKFVKTFEKESFAVKAYKVPRNTHDSIDFVVPKLKGKLPPKLKRLEIE